MSPISAFSCPLVLILVFVTQKTSKTSNRLLCWREKEIRILWYIVRHGKAGSHSGWVSPIGSQRRAEQISSSTTEHVFQITVPKQWSMRIFLDTDLKVTGEAGNVLETRQPSAQVISPAGRDQVTVNLLVP